MPYYGKEFSFSQLSCNDKSTEQICHIDKEGNRVILITNLGNYYTGQINGLNTKIEETKAIWDKIDA